MQFIGGFTAKQVVKRFLRLQSHGVHSILDYAKEANTTPYDVIKYTSRIHHLGFALENAPYDTPPALAVKLSSFMPHDAPEQVMVNTIRNFRELTGTRVYMFDAEDAYQKQLEDRTFEKLVLGFEQEKLYDVTLYKTFQAYRKDCYYELQNFIKYRLFHNIGVKLVRGAYHDPENDHTYFQDKQDTDDCYNACVRFVCEAKSDMPVCIATHNDESAMLAHDLIQMHTRHGISFAQLLGMNDPLTKTLVESGHTTYKYVPYGLPHEMIPYLGRRLIENYPVLCHL